MTEQTLKINLYAIVSRAVEEGIDYGWMRAHKHTDTPEEHAIKEQMEQGIMNAISEVIDFGDGE